MGERTWTAAQFYGVQPDAKPETPTTEALIKCIVNCSIKLISYEGVCHGLLSN